MVYGDIVQNFKLGNDGWCVPSQDDEVSDFWKSIISVKVDFSHWFHYRVHGGCRISFWHDEWCGQLVLHQFPNLYSLDGRQQAFVAENVCFVGGAVWDFSFCQNLMDN